MEQPTDLVATERATEENAVVSKANPDRKVYGAGPSKARVLNQIPDEILNDEKLAAAIAQLPSNYSFEIHKTASALIVFVVCYLITQIFN